MNPFEEICKLASHENWCWNLACSTCGHIEFRYAFAAIAKGKSPSDSDWNIGRRNALPNDDPAPLPRDYNEQQQNSINEICSKANLSEISKICSFPDWLGYLGLILEDLYSSTDSYKKLSKSWASQLSEMVPPDSPLHSRLSGIANGFGLLNIANLEACETAIRHNNIHRRNRG